MPSDAAKACEFDVNNLTPDCIPQVASTLAAASLESPDNLQHYLPAKLLTRLIDKAIHIYSALPTVVDVEDLPARVKVVVVGDTHGQFHDVLRMFEVVGPPCEERYYIFNGDFVDRGAWGVEVLTTLLCWTVAMPQRALMLRGNHESNSCTRLYGFFGELHAKYGGKAQALFKAFNRLFQVLPLAACVQRNTLILHGGLFRKPVTRAAEAGRKRKRKPIRHNAPLELGSLEDLRRSTKGGSDPGGTMSRATALATDVLWSDPVAENGLAENFARGLGLVFGPDITQEFLSQNNLKLIIRSHEGPDARCDRHDMQHMLDGYTFDHVVEAGKLMTVFSAPDYPQFQVTKERYGNKAAVAVLSAPDYHTPHMIQFDAQLPRPQVQPYFELPPPSEDEDAAAHSDGEVSSAATSAHAASSDVSSAAAV